MIGTSTDNSKLRSWLTCHRIKLTTKYCLPWVVDVDNDPRGDAAVDAGKVLSQPLPLGTSWCVVHIWGQVDHMAGAYLCAVVEV